MIEDRDGERGGMNEDTCTKEVAKLKAERERERKFIFQFSITLGS